LSLGAKEMSASGVSRRTTLWRGRESRQALYVNVTLGCICATVFAVEKKCYIFRVCLCSLCYQAYNAYAPYYIVICSLPGSTIFFLYYLINGIKATIFVK